VVGAGRKWLKRQEGKDTIWGVDGGTGWIKTQEKRTKAIKRPGTGQERGKEPSKIFMADGKPHRRWPQKSGSDPQSVKGKRISAKQTKPSASSERMEKKSWGNDPCASSRN